MGGYLLYAPKGWAAHDSLNYCGHFIWRLLEIAGVSDLNKIVGKTVRVELTEAGFGGTIKAIGHIINDDWFNPKEEFDEMRKNTKLKEIT